MSPPETVVVTGCKVGDRAVVLDPEILSHADCRCRSPGYVLLLSGIRDLIYIVTICFPF